MCGLAGDKRYKDKLVVKCGVMDNDRLDADMVKQVSTWPSREEQLSLLVGQILGAGSNLVSAFMGPGSTVAGQIATKAEGAEEEAPAEAAA